MSSQTVQIVLDGQDLASSEINQVSDNLGRLEGQAGGASGQVGNLGTEAEGTGNDFMGLGGKAGSAIKVLGGIAATTILFDQFRSMVIDLNGELGQFQLEIQRLETLVTNLSDSGAEAEESLEAMGTAIEGGALRSGEPISNLNELMTQLTLRFGDAEAATHNFDRAMDLMAFTGTSASNAARALSDAQQGYFQRLRREGVLTREQADHLDAMDDSTAAAAEAMEILDENIGGFVDKVPDAVDASDRLEQSWERLRIAAAELLGVDRMMQATASTMETLASQVEAFTSAWVGGTRSIREEMGKLDRQTRMTSSELSSLTDDTVLRDYERQLRSVRNEYDMQIASLRLIADQDANSIEELRRQEEAIRGIARLEEEREERLAVIEDSFIRQRSQIEGQSDFRQRQLALEQQALDATSEEERIRLETQRELNDLSRDREQSLNDLIDENGQILDTQEEQIIEQEFMVEVTRLQQEAEERINALKTEGVETQQGLNKQQRMALQLRIQAIKVEQMGNRELAIHLQQEADLIDLREQGLDPLEENLESLRIHIRVQEELNQLVEDDIDAQDRKTEALIRQNEEGLEESRRILESIGTSDDIGLTAADIIGEDIRRDLDRQIEQLHAYDLALRGVSDTFRTMSHMVSDLGRQETQQNRQNLQQLEERRRLQREMGEDTEHLDAHISALRAENDELRENAMLQQQRLDALASTTDHLAELSTSLADVADQQWDFEEASQSVVAAQQALSGAVGAALSAAGMGIKEQAAWMAAFSVAQAGAALGMALMFPSPSYWAAVANHTTAAAQFGLIASGVIGSGGGGATGSRGAGGAGGGGGASSVNRDSIIDEAMRRQEDIVGGPDPQQSLEINIDMSRSTNLRSATDTAEEIYTSIEPFLEDDL